MMLSTIRARGDIFGNGVPQVEQRYSSPVFGRGNTVIYADSDFEPLRGAGSLIVSAANP